MARDHFLLGYPREYRIELVADGSSDLEVGRSVPVATPLVAPRLRDAEEVGELFGGQ